MKLVIYFINIKKINKKQVRKSRKSRSNKKATLSSIDPTTDADATGFCHLPTEAQ